MLDRVSDKDQNRTVASDSPDIVISIISRPKLRRHFTWLVLVSLGLTALASLPIVAFSTGPKIMDQRILWGLFAVAAIYGVLFPIAQTARYFGKQSALVITNGELRMGNPTFGYSVVLAELQSLQDRRTASLMSFGLDKGVAIQLTSGRAFKIRGKPQPVAGTLSRWTYKCHMVIPDVYELESGAILESIYHYVSQASERKIEISRFSRRGREPLILSAEPHSADGVAQSPEPTSLERLLCVRCGYDLRAHGPEARCPECGAAVEITLRRPLLENADSRWVTSLRRGTLLLCLSSAAIAVLAYLEMRWIIQLIARQPVTGLFRHQLFNTKLAVASPFAIGIILFTRKSPDLDAGHDPRIRKLARFSLVLPIVALAVVYYGRLDLLTESTTVALATLLVGLLLLLYLRRLWDMVPDTLGRQWTTVASGLLAGILTVMLIAYAAFLVLLKMPNALQTTAARLGVPTTRPAAPTPPDRSLEWIAFLPGIVLTVSLAAFWLAISKFRQGGRNKLADSRSMT